MAEYTSTHRFISDIIQQLEQGGVAHFDANTRQALEYLEGLTNRFWGAPEAIIPVRQRLRVKCQLLPRIYPTLKAKCQQLKIAVPRLEVLWKIYLPVAEWVVEQGERFPKEVFVLGVTGAQGSGKSTLCTLLQIILEIGFGQQVAILSIDNFYLTQTERQHLADQVHPLFLTRGVPGTHDVALAIKVLQSLKAANPGTLTPLPIFDKALDDRLPQEKWPIFQGRPDIILFEGWCVGARPEPEQCLARPINSLEAEEDANGIWRGYVNQVLGEQYAQLFGLLEALLLLKIPAFKVVYAQRLEQEQQLAQALREGQVEAPSARRTMSMRELQRFIMHFQRLTESMLNEIPKRADLILNLDAHRQFQSARIKGLAPTALGLDKV